jgi:hypothetical protein
MRARCVFWNANWPCLDAIGIENEYWLRENQNRNRTTLLTKATLELTATDGEHYDRRSFARF